VRSLGLNFSNSRIKSALNTFCTLILIHNLITEFYFNLLSSNMNRNFFKISKLFSLGSVISKNRVAAFVKPKTGTTIALSSLFTFFCWKAGMDSKIFTLDDVRDVPTIKADELQEGEMKQFEVGPTKDDIILLYKFDGKYYATAGKCPHAGAGLEKGVLFDDKVYCPWHASAFSIVTGKPEQGPVFDDLPTFPVREENGVLVVQVPRVLPKSVEPALSKKFVADFKKFVILGSGPAALSAVETLRRCNFKGEIILITKEEELPYDRTVLSKNLFGAELDKITLKDQAFFDKCEVTVLKGTNVKYINIDKNLLEIEGQRDKIKFDKLLIATGGRPKVPPVSGTGLKNVMTLRNFKDMQDIKEAALKAKKIVIVGASFIGMEVAANIKKELKDKVEVTVVDQIKTPFGRVLGDDVGQAIMGLHEKNGVKFMLEKRLKQIEGAGSVSAVLLDDNSEIETDLVILGTGIRPNVDLVSSSLRISDDGGIYTDVFLKSSVESIFAAGDVASYPYWYTGNRVRVEHYNEAIQQGQIAAYNMIGKRIPHTGVPFFWSRMYDMSFRFVGYSGDFDSVHIDGNPSAMNFIAYYAKENKVVAAASVGRDPATMIISQAMQSNMMPSMEEIKSGNVTLDDIKAKLQSKKGCSRCKRHAYENKPVWNPPR